MAEIKFRLRELMAERERKTGENVTYRIIQEETGISPNTLSMMAQGKAKMIGLSTIAGLLDYFGCEVGELVVYE